MTAMTLTNAKVMLGTDDVSNKVKSVSLEYSAETQDVTAMGNAAKNVVAGMKDIKCDIELRQDYADGSIDELIFGLVGETVAVKIRPVNAAASVNNPEYQFNAIVTSHSPVSGSVGDTPTTKVSLAATGGTALTRATA